MMHGMPIKESFQWGFACLGCCWEFKCYIQSIDGKVQEDVYNHRCFRRLLWWMSGCSKTFEGSGW